MSFEAENDLENIDTQTGSQKIVLIYITWHLATYKKKNNIIL